MFSLSVRRAVRTPPLPPAAPARPSTPLIAATSSCVRSRTHQRRYSSSKPPIPPSDGSRNIDTSARTPSKDLASGVKDAPEKRSDGKIAKRRSKENADSASMKAADDLKYTLPSVPSTQHLHPNDIDLASFFSIHRPLSVTSSIPTAVTPEAFASIFSTKKSSRTKAADVIYTLSSALSGFESAMQQQQQQPQPQQQQQQQPSSSEESDVRVAVTQASSSNAETSQSHFNGASLSELKISIQELAKRFRPFNPPPAPVPMASEEGESLEELGSDADHTNDTQRRYSTILTIKESTNPDGLRTYSAHTGPLVRLEDEPSRGQQEIAVPPASRPLRYMERVRQQREQWHTISVKRQRKLKMKKHKYKKLRRRTRNLRKRLDRL